MQPNIFAFSVLCALLLIGSLGCGDDEEAPVEVAQPPPETPTLTPQEIADIAFRSTVRVRAHNVDLTCSGFIIGEGQIATNYEAIRGWWQDAAAELVLDETEYFLAEYYAIDSELNLLILSVEGPATPAIPLGDSDTVQVGDTVYIVGNSKTQKGAFSTGIISSILPDNDVSDAEVFQTTAPAPYGSSGGPVLNTKGEVIGIAVRSSVDRQIITYAIPVNYLKALQETGPIHANF